MTMRKIAILGATGSIGRQAIDVLSPHGDRFSVTALSAHGNAALLFDQVRRLRPRMAALTSGEVSIPSDLRFCDWYFGQDALCKIATNSDADDVLDAVSGMVGLSAVVSALKRGKRVLLANKEALVAGGEIVMRLGGGRILPVDSEHSAIFQCLRAADGNEAEEILLTASGGPFRTWDKESLARATAKDALCHPTWQMGRKITVDSASLFNKALEIIEARWLFDMPPERITVVVHPQSVIHSAVRFRDGAVIAQLGVPDMRLPILYAMSYPERLDTRTGRLDLTRAASLTFEAPDEDKFPALRMAREALNAGGGACCVLNAANEIAANAFLEGKILFGRIPEIVESTLSHIGAPRMETLDRIFDIDGMARRYAQTLITEA